MSKFKEAVLGVAELKECFHSGKSALGVNSSKVDESNSSLLNGSVALDDCLKKVYPSSNRWDYVVGYEGKAYFIEVHHASTSEVATVIKKFEWLKEFLRTKGKPINKIKAEDAFHWIFTNRNTIGKGSSSYKRKLIKSGLGEPKRKLELK